MSSTAADQARWDTAVAEQHLRPRPGETDRYDVADATVADTTFGCPDDDWCILQAGHPARCCEDRHTPITRKPTVTATP